MKNKELIVKLVLLAILAAITIVLQAVATNIKIGGFSPALALVPIAIGGILLGVTGGTILGTIWGLYIIIFDPSCQTFLGINVFGTIVTVVVRGLLAGLLPALAFKGIKRFNQSVAMIVAAILVPVTNSVSFRVFGLMFFRDVLFKDSTVGKALFTAFSVSMALEVGISAVFAPVIARICYIGDRQLNLGIFDIKKDEEESLLEDESDEASHMYNFDDNKEESLLRDKSDETSNIYNLDDKD